jgi:hypothetical protein
MNSTPRGRRKGEEGIAPAPRNGGRPSDAFFARPPDEPTSRRPRKAIDKRRDAARREVD